MSPFSNQAKYKTLAPLLVLWTLLQVLAAPQIHAQVLAAPPTTAKNPWPQLTTEQVLAESEFRAWSFFWEKADARTGLVQDRAPNRGGDTYTVASIASTGYALAAIPIAIERGWIGRNEGAARAQTTLDFLLTMPNQHGWLHHFVDKRDGKTVWNSEISTIDTALLICGALVCGQSFAETHPQITQSANQLYERIDWQWMLTNGGAQPEKLWLSHGWRDGKFLDFNYEEYSEITIALLLGMGAKTNSLPPACWDALRRPTETYAGITNLRGGPIFIHQMPHGWFDLKNKRDRLGWDYWVSSKNAIKIQSIFASKNADKFQTFHLGWWALNASDGPRGYNAYGVPPASTDGTVSPTGAIASITFDEAAARNFARDLYEIHRAQLWGDYGFGNAFNVDENWFDSDVIGIDLGMMLLALENQRAGTVWRLMNAHPMTQRALRAAGLRVTPENAERVLKKP